MVVEEVGGVVVVVGAAEVEVVGGRVEEVVADAGAVACVPA